MKKQHLYLIPITITTTISLIVDISSMLFIFVGELLEEAHKEIKKFNKRLIYKYKYKYNNDNSTTKKREQTNISKE